MQNQNKDWYSNLLSRVFGGDGKHGPYVADPYLKGYGFVYIQPIQTVLEAEAALTLSALARAVTLSNITLEAETIEGLGGVKFTHPTKLTMPDRITIEFMEVQDAFVMNTFKRWVSLIRDIRFGASNLTGGATQSPKNSSLSNASGSYSKKKFATTIHLIITLPDAETPIQSICFTGAYPLTIPLEHYGFNVTDHTKADISIEFAFDNIYFTDMGKPGDNLNPQSLTKNLAYQKIVKNIGTIKEAFINSSSNFDKE